MLTLVGVGVVVGLLAALGLTRGLAKSFFDVKPTDSATFE